MKNKKGVCIILIWIYVFLLLGCNKNIEKKYYDNSKDIHINITSSILSFNLTFITSDKIKEVKYLLCQGKNFDYDNVNVSIVNNSLDMYKDKKIDGLYCSNWTVNIEFEQEGYYEVDSLTLELDGEKKEIEFTDPIKYTKGEENNIINDEFKCDVFPCSFPSSYVENDEVIQYEFNAEKNFKLLETTFSDYFDASVIKVFLNDKEVGFPVDIKEGDNFTFKIKFSSQNKRVNKYCYVMGNLFIKYEFNGNEIKRNGALVFDPISPMDEKLDKLKELIDYVVK